MSTTRQTAPDPEAEDKPEQAQALLPSLISPQALSDRDLILLAGALLAEIRRRGLPFDDDD